LKEESSQFFWIMGQPPRRLAGLLMLVNTAYPSFSIAAARRKFLNL
jgi:hypothetical protein